MSLHQLVKWKALKFDLKYGTKLQTDVEVASEGLFDLYVNENLYMTAVLTPFQLKEWSIGFLYSEGLINSAREVKRVVINDDSIEVKIREDEDIGRRLPKIGRFLSDSCTSTIALKRISYIKEVSEEIFSNDLTIPKDIIRDLSISLNKASMTYRTTGGTHSAALFNTEGELLIYSEDVGRHNAVDKAIGSSLIEEIRLDDKILAVSGRLSEELVFKCARARIPLVISLSAPLSRGLELAKMAGITLIGFARGIDSMFTPIHTALNRNPSSNGLQIATPKVPSTHYNRIKVYNSYVIERFNPELYNMGSRQRDSKRCHPSTSRQSN